MLIKLYTIRNGKGYIKEYDNDGHLILEGDILNREKNGKRKEYDNEGKLVYEGKYIKGMRMEKEKNTRLEKCFII